MRQTLFTRGDEELALALAKIGELAHREGLWFDGFESWNGTAVGSFIEERLPPHAP